MRRRSEGRMTDTGLQKVAFFLLLGLIVYVAASGGGV
jgi:hypothetical protein